MKTWADLQHASMGLPWGDSSPRRFNVTGALVYQVIVASESIGREAALISGLLAMAEMAQRHFDAHVDCMARQLPSIIVADAPKADKETT